MQQAQGRDKSTPVCSADWAAALMPVLPNAKHEVFAQELAKGMSADKSYETAGFAPNRHNAATLARKQHILARVAELLADREAIHGQATAEAIKSTALTKQWVIETLMENVARSMQAKPASIDEEGKVIGEYQYQGGVANKALELLGKELGMFIERREVGHAGDFDKMTDDELREFVSGRPGTEGKGKARPLAERGRDPPIGKPH